MRRVAALIVAILLVILKKMILVLMPYRNSARRKGSDKQQSNKGLPDKVCGSLNLGQYLENLYKGHHISSSSGMSCNNGKSSAFGRLFLCSDTAY